MSTWILTASCPDRAGIVAAVSGLLADRDCFIEEAAHHSDTLSGRFFTRVVFRPSDTLDRATFSDAFAHIAARFDLRWQLGDTAARPRVLLLVSKHGHCLNDLLYRYRSGILPIEIPAIVSNHETFADQAAWHDIPFHHLPVTKATKPAQETRLLELVREQRIDLVVLARYSGTSSGGC